MKAKNRVVAGDYIGGNVTMNFGMVMVGTGGFAKVIELSNANVESYEVLDQERRKSAKSAVGRAFVGSVALGGVGLLAGLTAKNKGVHLIAIEFKDGKKSLIEVDEKKYKAIVKKIF